MLLQHQTGGGGADSAAGKWQSFSIRCVLGDALHDDDDDQEDVDVVVDAGQRLTPHGDELASPTDLSKTVAKNWKPM